MQPRKLSPTSSSVLLWMDGRIYESDFSQKFLDRVNLDSGRELMSKCDQVWPHYGMVIRNRKHCILNLTKHILKDSTIRQMVILGAGVDPLSIEMCSYFKELKVFELDYDCMDLKTSIIQSIDPGLADSISCITVDISKPDKVIEQLTAHGWRNEPSLVIAEGISYYLPSEEFWNLIGRFKTNTHDNKIILEYLLPDVDIAEDRATIPNRIFEIIFDHLKTETNVTKYNIGKINGHLQRLDGVLSNRYKMMDMEKNRTGQNRHFPSENSGWIEICCFSI